VTGSTATGGGSLTLSNSSLTFSAQQGGTAPASQTLSVSASTNTSYTATASSNRQLAEHLAYGQSDYRRQPDPYGFGVPVGPDGEYLLRHDYTGGQRRHADGSGDPGGKHLDEHRRGRQCHGYRQQHGGDAFLGFHLPGRREQRQQFRLYRWQARRERRRFVHHREQRRLAFGRCSKWHLAQHAGESHDQHCESGQPRGWTLQRHHHHHADWRGGGHHSGQPDRAGGADGFHYIRDDAVVLVPGGQRQPDTRNGECLRGGASLGFTVQVTSGSNWLSVSPTSGTTPTTGTAAVTVTATPGTLGAGTYNGTVLVSGTGTAIGSTSINVTLTVTAPAAHHQ